MLSCKGSLEVGGPGWFGGSMVIRDPTSFYLFAPTSLACCFHLQGHKMAAGILVITLRFQARRKIGRGKGAFSGWLISLKEPFWTFIQQLLLVSYWPLCKGGWKYFLLAGDIAGQSGFLLTREKGRMNTGKGLAVSVTMFWTLNYSSCWDLVPSGKHRWGGTSVFLMPQAEPQLPMPSCPWRPPLCVYVIFISAWKVFISSP